jgi:hypothetical protein
VKLSKHVISTCIELYLDGAQSGFSMGTILLSIAGLKGDAVSIYRNEKLHKNTPMGLVLPVCLSTRSNWIAN